MVLWENSGLFRGILASTAVVDDEGFQMLTIHGINPHDMEYILTFFDDPFRQVDGRLQLTMFIVSQKL